jgi:hypothetical protein
MVMPYLDKYKPRVVDVADGCTAFDDPVTGETFILDVFQALDMTGDLQDPLLLCPNQLHANGLIVDDVPKHLCHNCKSTHSIYIPEMKLRVSLELQGVMSGFQAWLPTQMEIETCIHTEVTAQEAWDPSSDKLEQQERIQETRLSNVAGTVSTLISDRKSEISAVLSSVSSTLVDDDFVCGMEQSVWITLVVASSTVRTKLRHSTMEPRELLHCWGIGLSIAQKNLRMPTQKGLRTAAHPLHCRYHMQQQQLCYNHLQFYSDTMFSSLVSVQGISCGQITVNNLDYSKFIPLKSNGDAGMALEELLQDIRVPTHMHTDGAKELTTGHWRKVYQSYGPVKQTMSEPLTPWQNRVELEIRELKKHVLCIMSHEGIPQRFWDYVVCFGDSVLHCSPTVQSQI